jgi:heptosyltransferase-2
MAGAARVLIISPNWIGDAVMAQPLLQRLQARAGCGPIDVLASPAVAPVWRAMAGVSSVIETPFRHGALQWAERRAMAAQLRQHGYAEAYVLPNTLKFALIPWLARIPRRVGYRGEMRYGLLNVVHHDATPVPRPMVAFYAALAAPPAATLPAAPLPRPTLQVDDAVSHAVLARFGLCQSLGLGIGRPLVVFAPGAEFGTAKRWPVAHFAQLATLVLAAHPQAQVVLLGSPKDRAVCDAIVAAAAPAGADGSCAAPARLHNLAGDTTLSDAIALLAAATALVANDSGLLHVAAALNRPVVALYGPTDPLHAPPLADVAATLSLHLTCAPCRQRECPLGHHDCMVKLLPEMVWQPLQEMLAPG